MDSQTFGLTLSKPEFNTCLILDTDDHSYEQRTQWDKLDNFGQGRYDMIGFNIHFDFVTWTSQIKLPRYNHNALKSIRTYLPFINKITY